MSGWTRRPSPQRTPFNPYHPDNDPDLRQRRVSVASSGVSSLHGDNGTGESVDLTTPTTPQGGWARLHTAPPPAPPAASYHSSTNTERQHEYTQPHRPIAHQSFSGAPPTHQQQHPRHPPPQEYQPAPTQHDYGHQQQQIWRPSPEHHQPPVHHAPPSGELPPSSQQSSGTSSSRRRRALDGMKRGLRRVKSGLSVSSQASSEEQRAANHPYLAQQRDGPSSRSRFFASASRVLSRGGERRDGSTSPPPVPAIPAQHQHHQTPLHATNVAEVPTFPEHDHIVPPSAPWTQHEVSPYGEITPEGRPLRRVDSNEDFYRQRMAQSRRDNEDHEMTAARLASFQSGDAHREARYQRHVKEQAALDSLTQRRQ